MAVAKKDFNLPKHADIDTKNLYVIKACQSLTSRGFLKTQFSWQWYYYTLTPEGLDYLREWLHLPAEIVPQTHVKQQRSHAPPRGMMGGEGERERRPGGRGGPRGDREGREGGYAFHSHPNFVTCMSSLLTLFTATVAAKGASATARRRAAWAARASSPSSVAASVVDVAVATHHPRLRRPRMRWVAGATLLLRWRALRRLATGRSHACCLLVY